MRIKLFLKNLKHHLLLSILLFIVTTTLSTLVIALLNNQRFLIESDKVVLYNQYNQFDLVIKSKTPLSLHDTKHQSEKDYSLINEYEKVAPFYQASLIIEASDKSGLINVFEGKIDTSDNSYELNKIYNYQNAFSFNSTLNPNEVIITEEVASKYNLKKMDTIKVYINNKATSLTVKNIVKNEGILTGQSVLIYGNILSKTYAGLPNFSNLILIKAKDPTHIPLLYNKLSLENKSYHNKVINIFNDDIYNDDIYNNTNMFYIIIIISLIVIFFVILKMYRYKLDKQAKYFSQYKKSYYNSFKLFNRIILITISYIISIIFAKLLFVILAKSYPYDINYKITPLSYIVALCFLLVLMIIISIPKIKINSVYSYVTEIIITIIIFIGFIVGLIIKNRGIKALFIILLSIFIVIWIVKLLRFFSSKIRSFMNKLYIYSINKKNKMTTMILTIYVLLGTIFSLVLIPMHKYTTSIKKMDKLVNIELIAIPTSNNVKLEQKDKIGIIEHVEIKDVVFSNVLVLNKSQLEKYIDIDTSNTDYSTYDIEPSIVLPIYYHNLFNVNIGDYIDIKLSSESNLIKYKVVDFINHIYSHLIVLSQTNKAIDGYVLKHSEINSSLISDVINDSFSFIDINEQITSFKQISLDKLNLITFLIVMLIIVFVLILIYLSYLDFSNQRINIIKIKKLGYNNKKIIKLVINKMLLQIICSIIIGFILSIIVTHYFDDVASLIKSTYYIYTDMKIILISILIGVSTIIIGNMFSIYKINKLGGNYAVYR